MFRIKNNALVFILILSVLTTSLYAQNRQYSLAKNAKHEPLTIIVKLKNNTENISKSNIQQDTKTISPSDFTKNTFIQSQKPISYHQKKQYANGRKPESKFLSNIYRLTLSDSSQLLHTINRLLEYDNVLYAEPLYADQLLFTPNDANVAFQDYLEVIKAYDAWDVTIGDTAIIVGVIDTGLQLDHEDLQSKLAFNPLETDNGIDDDGNGYIDDLVGWDFADDDNDANADGSDHGTRVSGISNAHANNTLGIAGVGYRSKVVPLKIFNTSSIYSFNNYEAIIYAADQGYKVINLSWGAASTYSQFNQDVFNYVTIEKDLVVVAAAGNTNAELNFYPASYDNVLSVGSSDIEDNKADYATYSYNIDLLAPGLSVYSTTNGNGYGAARGSSYAAPQVAGAAALVRDAFPDLNALQVMQQLRVTADDIYEIGSNDSYLGQLGKGRLNVYRAVSDDTIPAIRMENLSYSGAFANQVFFDDTVQLKLDFINYLSPTVNATASISSSSPYITFLSSSDFSLGHLNALDFVNDADFSFYINAQAPPSERIIFRIDFADDKGYSDFQYFEIQTQPDYLILENDSISFTIASDGNLAHANDDRAETGFRYKGEKIADNFGILIANHPDSVSNTIIYDYAELLSDTSFVKGSNLKLIAYDSADYYAKSNFNDSNAGDFSLGLHIEQEILAWETGDDENFIILEYRISNPSVQKTNLSFGLFADWDVQEAYNNRAAWDASNMLGYSYDIDDSLFAGVALLTSQTATYHAIDVRSENTNSSEIQVEFSKAEKHDFLTNAKHTAGILSTGNDVAMMLGALIDTLDLGASAKLAYVITAANSLADLQANVAKAQAKYSQFISNPPISYRDTTCINESFTLHINSGSTFELYDDAFMSNLLLSGNDFDMGILIQDTVIYYRNIDAEFATDISKLKIKVSDPQPNFMMDTDTFYLGDNPLNQVQFTDTSADAISWMWDFDNGNLASIQNPLLAFNELGLYNINLSITSSIGCIGNVSKQLLVAQRSPEPSIANQTICYGATTSITASDASNLLFYLTASDNNPIFEGSEFTTGAITSDTIFYVSSIDMTFESHRVAVEIILDDISAEFDVQLDTLDLSKRKLLTFNNMSEAATAIAWYVDDVLIGNEEQERFEFTDETIIAVKERVYSSMGCPDSLTQNINLTKSLAPSIADTILLCKYQGELIAPTDGNVFYFYSDADKDNLVHKGTSIYIENLSKDSMIYITNVSEFLESDVVSVLLQIIPFETEIMASPDFLIIEEGRNVTFSASNTDAVSWEWYLEYEFVEIVASPTIKFDTAGVYELQVIVQNTEGCRDTANLAYEVRHITGFNDNANDIKVFPNPVKDELTVYSENGSIKDMSLYNYLGAKMSIAIQKSDNGIRINTTTLPSGIYLLKGKLGKREFSRKVVVRR